MSQHIQTSAATIELDGSDDDEDEFFSDSPGSSPAQSVPYPMSTQEKHDALQSELSEPISNRSGDSERQRERASNVGVEEIKSEAEGVSSDAVTHGASASEKLMGQGATGSSATAQMSDTTSDDDSEHYTDDGDDKNGDDLVASANDDSEEEEDYLAAALSQMGLEEDHFSQPSQHQTDEQLTEAIEKAKAAVLAADNGPDKEQLIGCLVELRLQREELKDKEDEDEIVEHCGHRLQAKTNREVLEESQGGKLCEVCRTGVSGLRVRQVLTCVDCRIVCHRKCLQTLRRPCAVALLQDSAHPLLGITIQRGLSKQSFSCYECPTPLSYSSASLSSSSIQYQAPLVCNYNGRFLCQACMWTGDTAVIPARIIHNWDFEPRPVSRTAKHYISLISQKPMFNLQEMNPSLFAFVEELREVDALRRDLLVMKDVFLSCPAARTARLLLLLETRQHFVESSELYSLRDLEEVDSDVLLPHMLTVHSTFQRHIKVECETCKKRGDPCSTCGESVFSFDKPYVCPLCEAVAHNHCHALSKICRRCLSGASSEVNSYKHGR